MKGAYKLIELIGSSKDSWEDAAQHAIEHAGKSLRDIRVAEVVEMDLKIDKDKAIRYRVRLNVSFKIEDS